MEILVDTSVWIAADKKNSAAFKTLKDLIQKGDHTLLVSSVIETEVCQGARDEIEFTLFQNAFKGFPHLELNDLIWEKSAWNSFKCRKKGHSVSTIDCVIATLAETYRVALWTLDKDFNAMQKHIAFELYEQ